MVGRFSDVKQGYLPGHRTVLGVPEKGRREADRAGVRASIVAKKPGNAGGAKGRRKMDDE